MLDTPLVESQEKGWENKGNKHTMQKCLHGSKNIQMAAMDSQLSDCVVFLFSEIVPNCRLPKWDWIFNQNTLFHRSLIDMNNVQGAEGGSAVCKETFPEKTKGKGRG